jgi:hypothetical protein
VARTVVQECGFEAQDGDACIRLKLSGRELHGDLWTRGAMCNSACPYLILGATTREIAPDTVLAVHSPKVVVRFSGGVPTQQMRAAATQRGIERADLMLSKYVFRMGAEGALLDLARNVKFESLHVLTREEIAAFGIDRRDFVETPWSFENGARSLCARSRFKRTTGRIPTACRSGGCSASPPTSSNSTSSGRRRPPRRSPPFRFRPALRSR